MKLNKLFFDKTLYFVIIYFAFISLFFVDKMYYEALK